VRIKIVRHREGAFEPYRVVFEEHKGVKRSSSHYEGVKRSSSHYEGSAKEVKTHTRKLKHYFLVRKVS
jgi:hypothetical protein